MENIDHNLWEFDFWNKPTELDKQLPIQNFPNRYREINRDYDLINQSHQWEPRYFLKILNETINLLSLPDGYKGTGRPSVPVSEKLKVCCIKQFNLKGGRRTVHHIESARAMGYLFIPNISENYFNMINNYTKDSSLTQYLQKLIILLAEPLAKKSYYFAVDGTGFKIGYGKKNYCSIRTDKDSKREYIGLHAIADVESHIIPYAIVSKGHVHDNNFFKPLIKKTNETFTIKEVYAVPAYLSKNNVEFCKALNIASYLKPKSNTVIKGLKNSAWRSSIERYYQDEKRKQYRRYSLRSNIESAFHMIKSVNTDILRHKTFEGRVNELLARIVCHNIRCLVTAYFKGDIDLPFLK